MDHAQIQKGETTIQVITRLRKIKLPPYLEAKYIKIGLLVGGLWGLLSTVAFVTVGMFGETNHPSHWLFLVFQNSVQVLWFQALFLPFFLSLKVGFFFAFFGSTPVGATIGAAVGAAASILLYKIRRAR